jgi:hypothetical protein
LPGFFAVILALGLQYYVPTPYGSATLLSLEHEFLRSLKEIS